MYEYECGKCGSVETLFRSIDDRHDGPICCGRKATLLISVGHIVEDIPAYVSPTSGNVISSGSDRREDLRRSNARPWEGLGEERKEAARKRQYADDKLDKKLDHGIREIFHQLPPRKRRVLEE